MKTPAVAPHCRLQTVSGEGALALSERGAKAFYGAAYERVVPLIDGCRSADDIADALAGSVDAATVYYVLNILEQRGCVAEATPEIPPALSAFWHEAGVEPRAAMEALRRSSVAVFVAGNLDSSPLETALKEAGVRTGPKEPADLWVVVADDYQRDELREINREALAARRPWLLLRPTGPEAWIGPLFLPGETACFRCLLSRLERNRSAHALAKRLGGGKAVPSTSVAALLSTLASAYGMAATEAARFLAGASRTLAGKLLSLDWTDWSARTHALVRHPYCPACGTEAPREAKPLPLEPGRATFNKDGGRRAVSPERTLKRYEHLISPITGVVKELRPVRSDDDVAVVYAAGHNTALKMDRLDSLRRSLRSSSSGKGASEAQARASALCEAVERYSGEWTGGELRIPRALNDWSEGEAIHPNDVMRFSERQYAEREVWNSRGSRFNRVPEPFDPERIVDWTPVWSLTEERHKYLPTQLLYYRAPARDGDEAVYSIGCSNGAASGNTLAEALLQGFFELVERDAVAVWWYNMLSRPGVDAESFGDPWIVKLAAYYRERWGREAWALDITSDLGIPAFVAVSRRIGEREERLFFGLGCHLDARIALQRAFAEMNQMLSVGSGGGEDDLAGLQDKETLSWMRTATLANKPYMAPDPSKPLRTFSDYPVRHTDDFLEDIAYCRRLIEAKGMEMLALDQTRPDTGMPVVKVVVPGFRHFWARFAPGRLYDVPAATGLLKKTLKEEELNPVPFFF